MNQKPAMLGGSPVFPQSIPFARPTLPPYSELEDGFREIVETGTVTKGKYLDEYEKALGALLEVPYALGVVNCTMGLFMLLKAMGVEGEVILPSFSFMSTFHVVEILGMIPVFVDCERDTFTIDPKKVEEAITPRTSAVMGVSVFGNPPDMHALEMLAKKHGIKLLMDSAHSLGTTYMGHPMGSHGDGEVFSTSATKLIATGEGGIITTTKKEIYDFIKIYREYGNNGDYDCAVAGINGRMSEFHSLLGLKGIKYLEEYAEKRNQLARLFREEMAIIPGISFQKIRDGCRSSYKDFALIIEEVQFGLSRDELAEALLAEGIPTKKYFQPPGHRQKVYAGYLQNLAAPLVNTDFLAGNVLIVPFYSHMKKDLAGKIVEAIERIHRFAPSIKERLRAL